MATHVLILDSLKCLQGIGRMPGILPEASHCSASCNWREAGRLRFPLRQSMCASGLSEQGEKAVRFTASV